MTSTMPLFPEIVDQICDPSPEPCKWPLFLVAYWTRNREWAIRASLQYADTASENLKREIATLRKSGWTHVTIMRLPPNGPWTK